MNEDQLRIQALLESLGELTQKYEKKVADLRVEITLLGQENGELRHEIARLRDRDQLIVEGELVQEEE